MSDRITVEHGLGVGKLEGGGVLSRRTSSLETDITFKRAQEEVEYEP